MTILMVFCADTMIVKEVQLYLLIFFKKSTGYKMSIVEFEIKTEKDWLTAILRTGSCFFLLTHRYLCPPSASFYLDHLNSNGKKKKPKMSVTANVLYCNTLAWQDFQGNFPSLGICIFHSDDDVYIVIVLQSEKEVVTSTSFIFYLPQKKGKRKAINVYCTAILAMLLSTSGAVWSVWTPAKRAPVRISYRDVQNSKNNVHVSGNLTKIWSGSRWSDRFWHLDVCK